MFEIHDVTGKRKTWVHQEDTLEKAIMSLLEHWEEDINYDTMYVYHIEKDGKIEATVTTGATWDHAVILYRGGRMKHYTAKYITDENGRYLRTEIKEFDYEAQQE